MNDQKNLLIAVVLSLSVMFGFNYLNNYLYPEKAQILQEASSSANSPTSPASPSAVTSAGTSATNSSLPTISTPLDRSQALALTPRIKIETPKIHGSINLKGARFDDVSLADYRETTDTSSPEIVLLSPAQSPHGYYADFGWISTTQIPTPSAETVWTADRDTLTVGHPATLRWDNGQGLVFERIISVDDLYVFTVKDRVINKMAQPIRLSSYGQISRLEKPETGGFFILHEGPIGVINNKLKELDYDKLLTEPLTETTTGGWLGITDKYWLVSLIPDQKTSYKVQFKGQTIYGQPTYQTEAISPEQEIAAGASLDIEYHLFSGAKKLRMLDAYEEKLGFSKFDLAIDFGWFYFLTKPVFYLIEYLNQILGNLGLAILVMTVLFKIALFPLANKSYRNMSRMKQLQPKIEALKNRFPEDKMRLNQEMMELYKKEKINPLSGCLPMLIQAPIFFCLYKVLFVTLEMRQAPFFGWIHDLAAPDSTSIFNLFGLLPFDPPSFLMIGAWPLIMGATMILQQKMSPQSLDPVPAKMFMVMPIMMTFLFASFPSGLVIYWAWSNLLSIAQQWWIMRLEERRAR